MKKVNKYLSVLALATLVSSTSYSADFAIDVHAGLMGAGVGGTVGINDYLNVRGGFNGADANGDFEEDGLTYQADLELDNQYVMLDLYPFKGKFRFTAGIYNNSNGFGGSATAGPTGATIGEGADEIDVPANSSISLDVAYNDSMSTYVGVGFGNPVSNGGGFGFSVDLGLVATGNFGATIGIDQATRDLITANPAVTNQDIDDAIAAEQSAIEDNDDFKDIDVWPLLQIGLSYGF